MVAKWNYAYLLHDVVYGLRDEGSRQARVVVDMIVHVLDAAVQSARWAGVHMLIDKQKDKRADVLKGQNGKRPKISPPQTSPEQIVCEGQMHQYRCLAGLLCEQVGGGFRKKGEGMGRKRRKGRLRLGERLLGVLVEVRDGNACSKLGHKSQNRDISSIQKDMWGN